MMPLMMRRSSSRSGPVSPVGRCGSIRAHCLSFNQNKPARILSPPNQEHGGKRITWRYLGTDPSPQPPAPALSDLPLLVFLFFLHKIDQSRVGLFARDTLDGR